MTNNSHLHPYLGFKEDGSLALFVSPAPNSIIGNRLEKPHPLPDLVKNFHNNPTPEQALPALQALQKYLNGEDVHEEAPVFGEILEKKRRKTR